MSSIEVFWAMVVVLLIVAALAIVETAWRDRDSDDDWKDWDDWD